MTFLFSATGSPSSEFTPQLSSSRGALFEVRCRIYCSRRDSKGMREGKNAHTRNDWALVCNTLLLFSLRLWLYTPVANNTTTNASSITTAHLQPSVPPLLVGLLRTELICDIHTHTHTHTKTEKQKMAKCGNWILQPSMCFLLNFPQWTEISVYHLQLDYWWVVPLECVTLTSLLWMGTHTHTHIHTHTRTRTHTHTHTHARTHTHTEGQGKTFHIAPSQMPLKRTTEHCTVGLGCLFQCLIMSWLA